MGVGKYQPVIPLLIIMGRIRLDLSSLDVPEDESRLMMLLDSRFKSIEDIVRHLSKSYPEIELGKVDLYLNQHFLPHLSSTNLLQDEDLLIVAPRASSCSSEAKCDEKLEINVELNPGCAYNNAPYHSSTTKAADEDKTQVESYDSDGSPGSGEEASMADARKLDSTQPEKKQTTTIDPSLGCCSHHTDEEEFGKLAVYENNFLFKEQQTENDLDTLEFGGEDVRAREYARTILHSSMKAKFGKFGLSWTVGHRYNDEDVLHYVDGPPTSMWIRIYLWTDALVELNRLVQVGCHALSKSFPSFYFCQFCF